MKAKFKNMLRRYAITTAVVAVFCTVACILCKYWNEDMAVPILSYNDTGDVSDVSSVAYDDIFYDDDDNNTTVTVSSESSLIDLNNTSVKALTGIKGIGNSTAEKIIEYAENYGFNSVDELTNVKGIGESKLEAIRPYVTVYVTAETSLAESETDAAFSDDESDIEVYETYEAYTETAATTKAVTFPLDLNTASTDELTQIKGVGDVLASRICEYAKSTGFSSVSDLMNVKGIGDAKFAAISPYVMVPDPVTSAETGASETTAKVSETTTSETENQNTSESLQLSETSDVSAVDDIFPIELNTATKEELVKINGIGDVTAEKIVEYAQSTGFTCVDDLINVKGIGEKKLENIRPYVYVK